MNRRSFLKLLSVVTVSTVALSIPVVGATKYVEFLVPELKNINGIMIKEVGIIVSPDGYKVLRHHLIDETNGCEAYCDIDDMLLNTIDENRRIEFITFELRCFIESILENRKVMQ